MVNRGVTLRRLDERARQLLARWPAAAPKAQADEIRRLQNECGCRAGALTLLLVAPFAAVALVDRARELGTWRAILTGVGVLFAGMAVGKIIGMGAARLRLAKHVAALEKLAGNEGRTHGPA